MNISIPRSHVIIVDTENYAGNFERELCAYATGQAEGQGAFGRLSAIARSHGHEIVHRNWWRDNIAQEADWEGRVSICRIWETPGWYNDGLGLEFRDTPENHQRSDEAVRQWRAKHRPVGMHGSVTRYPAYLSVAIFVDEAPPSEVWAEFKDRVARFAQDHATIVGVPGTNPEPLTITGFRVVRPTFELEEIVNETVGDPNEIEKGNTP